MGKQINISIPSLNFLFCKTMVVRSPAFSAAALVTVDQIAAGTAVHAGLQLTLVHVDLAVLPPGQSWS